MIVYKIKKFKSSDYLNTIYEDLINLCIENPYYSILILGASVDSFRIFRTKQNKNMIVQKDKILFDNGSIIKVMRNISESRGGKYNYCLINEKFLRDERLQSHIFSRMVDYINYWEN